MTALVSTTTPASATDAPPARFIEGAMEVGGLTRPDAVRAWNDGRRDQVGVFEEESESVSRPAPPTSAQLARLAKSTHLSKSSKLTVRQKTIKKTRVIRSWAGIECAGLTVSKTFLYNGKRVWKDIVAVKPWANAWQGWQYEGVTHQSDQYGAIGGVTKRKHRSERHAKFSDAWGTPTQIAIDQEGRYDGGTSQSGRII
jgi:hypothetical protein